MASFTLMASVAEADIDAFQRDPARDLHPSTVSGASHLLSNWVQLQPLGRLLTEAVDGGEILHTELWHPFRPPKFHRPARVGAIVNQLNAAWASAKVQIPDEHDGGWLVMEVNRALRFYQHAATAGECVVTALESPGDPERAQRVRIPWKLK